jgi:hypothetical protein
MAAAIETNIWVAMTLFFLVLIFAWAKNALGSAKLAILFAVIVVYLTFYQHPELVWIVIGLFLLATFGKELVSKMEIYSH